MSWTAPRIRIAGVIALASLASCVTPLSPESMSPGILERPAQRGDRTLRVAPVTGGGEAPIPLSQGLEGGSYVGSEELQLALVDALDGSGIFRRVTTSEPGDFELDTRVVSQQSQATGGGITSMLVLNYRVREVATAQDVWRDTIITRGRAERGPEGPSGARRKSLSAAAQRNLTEMLKKMAAAIPAASARGSAPPWRDPASRPRSCRRR